MSQPKQANAFAALFNRPLIPSDSVFNSSLLRSRTSSEPAEPSAQPAASTQAKPSLQAGAQSGPHVRPSTQAGTSHAEPSGRAGNSPRPPAAPALPTDRASPVQHSPSSSGLGMAELLDQLDRATGRIHAFAGHRGKSGSGHSLLDTNPQTLLKVAGACLFVGQWQAILTLVHWMCSITNLCTLLGAICIALAAQTYIIRAWNLMTANVMALTLAVPKLPTMADEISEMLTQIKLMREDLQLMRSKVSWLPGS